VEQIGQSVPPVAPFGGFTGSVDEKGRLKLPAQLLTYLESFNDERRVFITTMDEVEARIYPISLWRETAKKLQEPEEDEIEAFESLSRLANHYGREMEVDAQGRFTFPDVLRKKLLLEKDEVSLFCRQGRIVIERSSVYEDRLAGARTDLAEKVKLGKKKAL
jgi:DNA-binding transcriptional regulator/RsmH inhibitor MraZ